MNSHSHYRLHSLSSHLLLLLQPLSLVATCSLPVGLCELSLDRQKKALEQLVMDSPIAGFAIPYTTRTHTNEHTLRNMIYKAYLAGTIHSESSSLSSISFAPV